MNLFRLRSLRSNLFAALLLTAASLVAVAPLAHAQEPNPIPPTFQHIYPAASQAQSQVQQAMQLATQQHKRILLVFGTDKCADCQAYETLLDSEHNRAQLSEHFLLVHINVGPKRNQNLDLVSRFGATVQRNIPAVSVIDGEGHVIHAQSINHARNMGDPDVTEFLNKWRG
jgi:thiol:disulfide interchange protein